MRPPAQPQPSASVVLVDPRRGGPEPFAVFLLRRSQKSSFMPDRFVFPGGRVEPEDGPDPLAPPALRRCALRELWEEAGVLLARRADGQPAGAAQQAEAARVAAGRELAAGLAAAGLELDPGCLRAWANWITPVARPQRFDTTFFLARMPDGQEAACDQRETSEGLWLGPAAALAANQAGRVGLAPPQVRLLGQLAETGLERLEALLAGPERLDGGPPVLPVLWAQAGRRVVLLPWDRDYDLGRPRDPADMGAPCPAGQASRLVDDRGRWLPYLS
ncbi:MAG: NUDIX hydrolase [Thermodesulfobacteriota bacterium]